MGSSDLSTNGTNTPPPPADAPPVDLVDVRKRMVANRKTLSSLFHERVDILGALDVTAVAREHILLVGKPGTAKSALARAWASQFSAADAVYREDLFTRQSTESDHLAYLDVKAFTNGDYVYKREGKITEAHFAFADEIFKANGGFLNALLGWLNERTGRGGYVSPLITAIGASNEFGEDESVAALEDRLMVRFWVESIQKRPARLAFLGASATKRNGLSLQPVSVHEITAAHEASRALPFDPMVYDALLNVQDALNGAQIYVSDRRLAKCVSLLQAYAWLDASPTVEVDHIDFLKNVLWRRPDDRTAVDTAIGAVDRGMIGEIRQIVEKTLEGYAQAKAQPDFKDHALSHASEIERCGHEIRARYGGKIPDRVKERAKGYLAELRDAFEDCKKSAGALNV